MSKRIAVENSYQKIEICLDWTSFQQKCQEENYPWEEFLLKIRDYGVSSLGLEEDTFEEIKDKVYIFTAEEREKLVLLGLVASAALPSGETWVFNDKIFFTRIKDALEEGLNSPLPNFKRGEYFFLSLPRTSVVQDLRFGYNQEKIKQAKNYGLKVLLQTDLLRPTEARNLSSSNSILSTELKENISGITLKSDHFLSQEDFLFNGVNLVLPEFSGYSWIRKFAPVSSQVVRLHYLGPEEYNLYQNEVITSPERAKEKILKRLIRAVKERNIRILYFHPLPKEYLKGKDDYFTQTYQFFDELKKNLKKENFRLGISNPFPEVNFFPQRTKFLRQFLALFIACLFPFLGLKFFFPPKKAIISFLLCSFLSLSAGILISTLLSGNEFFLKLDEFRGTKVALGLPILFALIYFYRDNWRDIFSQKISIGQFLVFLIIGLIFILFFIRSGESASFLLPGEDRLRSFFENIFWVRPRTKEFLFGHPLLILGLFLLNHPLIILGLIGQVSIVNTFLHLHTPFLVSLYRVSLGIFLGTIFGLILIKIYQIALKQWQK